MLQFLRKCITAFCFSKWGARSMPAKNLYLLPFLINCTFHYPLSIQKYLLYVNSVAALKWEFKRLITSLESPQQNENKMREQDLLWTGFNWTRYPWVVQLYILNRTSSCYYVVCQDLQSNWVPETKLWFFKSHFLFLKLKGLIDLPSLFTISIF